MTPRAVPRRAGLAWASGAAAVLVAAAVAAFVAAGHRTLPASAFEFGVARSFDGFVVADPYPSLIVPRGPASTRHLLVGPGKSGGDEIVRGFVDRWAALEGTLAYRDGQAIVELVPGSVGPSSAPGAGAASADASPGRRAAPLAPTIDLGERYLEGEIVGAKCHLGVMNPGSGLVHRSCAALCLRGGVPPLLAVRRTDGSTEGIVVTGPAGEAVGRALARLAGTPVGATGHLVRQGSATFFRVDPTQLRRVR